MGLALLLCVHVHSKWAPAFLGCLPSGIMRLPHCAPISGLRGELDQKQASSATSSSCPADAGQMPRSCSAGFLGHWEPGRHRIQHKVVRPLGRARRTSWKAAPPLSPPLLCSLSGADSSAAAVGPVLPFVTRPPGMEESPGALGGHRELSPAAKATKSPSWLKASPWTAGGGEAWRGLLEMEPRSRFSCAIGKDLSLMSLLCILF